MSEPERGSLQRLMPILTRVVGLPLMLVAAATMVSVPKPKKGVIQWQFLICWSLVAFSMARGFRHHWFAVLNRPTPVYGPFLGILFVANAELVSFMLLGLFPSKLLVLLLVFSLPLVHLFCYLFSKDRTGISIGTVFILSFISNLICAPLVFSCIFLFVWNHAGDNAILQVVALATFHALFAVQKGVIIPRLTYRNARVVHAPATFFTMLYGELFMLLMFPRIQSAYLFAAMLLFDAAAVWFSILKALFLEGRIGSRGMSQRNKRSLNAALAGDGGGGSDGDSDGDGDMPQPRTGPAAPAGGAAPPSPRRLSRGQLAAAASRPAASGASVEMVWATPAQAEVRGGSRVSPAEGKTDLEAASNGGGAGGGGFAPLGGSSALGSPKFETDLVLISLKFLMEVCGACIVVAFIALARYGPNSQFFPYDAQALPTPAFVRTLTFVAISLAFQLLHCGVVFAFFARAHRVSMARVFLDFAERALCDIASAIGTVMCLCVVMQLLALGQLVA